MTEKENCMVCRRPIYVDKTGQTNGDRVRGNAETFEREGWIVFLDGTTIWCTCGAECLRKSLKMLGREVHEVEIITPGTFHAFVNHNRATTQRYLRRGSRHRAEIEKEINASRRVEIPAGRTVTINDREFYGPCVVTFEPQIRWVSLDTIKEDYKA